MPRSTTPSFSTNTTLPSRRAVSRTLAAGAAALVVLAAGTPAASANPALAEMLKKSTVSDQAAGATTVADRLAERRFNRTPSSGGRTYTTFGYTIPRDVPGHHYGGHEHFQARGGTPPPTNGANRGAPLSGFDDPRVRDNFDLDHYDDEKPRADVEIHIGAGGRRHVHDHRNGGHSPVYYRNPYWDHYYDFFDPYERGYRNRWYRTYPYGFDGRLVQQGSNLAMPAPSQPSQTDPAVVPEPETPIETARRLTDRGQFDVAVDAFREHLADNPEDFAAMADLAVALAAADRFDDAAAMARLAYDRDPSLANRSPAGRVLIDSRDLRKIVVRAVRFAHDRDSASAWLLVSVLMQAEGRDPVGLRMLERAADRGLDPAIADPMRAALRS